MPGRGSVGRQGCLGEVRGEGLAGLLGCWGERGALVLPSLETAIIVVIV